MTGESTVPTVGPVSISTPVAAIGDGEPPVASASPDRVRAGESVSFTPTKPDVVNCGREISVWGRGSERSFRGAISFADSYSQGPYRGAVWNDVTVTSIPLDYCMVLPTEPVPVSFVVPTGIPVGEYIFCVASSASSCAAVDVIR